MSGCPGLRQVWRVPDVPVPRPVQIHGGRGRGRSIWKTGRVDITRRGQAAAHSRGVGVVETLGPGGSTDNRVPFAVSDQARTGGRHESTLTRVPIDIAAGVGVAFLQQAAGVRRLRQGAHGEGRGLLQVGGRRLDRASGDGLLPTQVGGHGRKPGRHGDQPAETHDDHAGLVFLGR